jgi:hypothetical protein
VVATAVLVLAVGIVRRTGPVRAAGHAGDGPRGASVRPEDDRPPRAASGRAPLAPAERAAGELAAAPDKFMNLPILRNLEKLEHFEASRRRRSTTIRARPNG